ncbi:hypothetical protein [Neogemmobacter tilapiae]|uniref:Uncharacterized protein n=1 Tax=Neogemmobacter tilapiae TaxID=875041 RepID=A0A918WJY8_9RHOB|nr:hypothetical protein [Gemmobacter tilapiae]GHC52729.1 hypothetical protein GCM10007315_14110 [Gemmobacter tilapiae]
MIRRAARAGLFVLLVLSLGLTGLAALRISRDPLIRPFVDAGADQIAAAMEQAMAQEATPERLTLVMTRLLAEEPRNWLAIQAVEAVAEERRIALPEALVVQRAAMWEADSSYLVQAGQCATCVWDAGTCTISTALICNAPIQLTPIGDVVGLTKAGSAWATGGDVDEIDLGLSIIGLGATAAVLASGGTSFTLKAGAGMVKLARKMGILSPRLVGMIGDVIRRGVDWQMVGRMDFSDPAKLIRADVVAPLASVASDLGRMGARLPMGETLHLVRYVDDAAEARRLANAAEALGPKTIGAVEVLGKSRFLRATVRLSDVAVQVGVGLVGLLLSLGGVLGGLAQSASLRVLRRLARDPVASR